MKKYDVEHFLNIYSMRKGMQEAGITNPSEQIKKFTKDFVEKLETLPINEEIILQDNSFFDTKGNLIIKIPFDLNEQII
jgi:hypothetical protein